MEITVEKNSLSIFRVFKIFSERDFKRKEVTVLPKKILLSLNTITMLFVRLSFFFYCKRRVNMLMLYSDLWEKRNAPYEREKIRVFPQYNDDILCAS